MTKASISPETGDIEVTPEMVKAGEDVIFSDARDLLALGLEGPEILAIRVYRAMYSVGLEKQ